MTRTCRQSPPTSSSASSTTPICHAARQRKPRALIGIATIVAIAVIAGQQHSGPSPAAPRLPSTPQQWVSQWTAATLQSPAEVCGHLYAPALARAFKGDTGHSCTWYYTSVKSTSFRIRHVLEDGPTAAVEAQQLGAGRKWGYFTHAPQPRQRRLASRRRRTRRISARALTALREQGDPARSVRDPPS